MKNKLGILNKFEMLDVAAEENISGGKKKKLNKAGYAWKFAFRRVEYAVLNEVSLVKW